MDLLYLVLPDLRIHRGMAKTLSSLTNPLTKSQYYKANPNEILAGPEELPSAADKDYNFNATRNPPIL